ncbi:MAG: ABC transporter ATP-binding protein [Candidatus Aminicenantaceae bacterium]
MGNKHKKKNEKDIIYTKNLKKVYKGDGIEVDAMRGVDFKISSGEFTAVVGPSGSGKTTLLNVISGLDSPTKGKVWLNGKMISEMKKKEISDFRRDNIGFVFQAYNLIPVLKVEENIEYIMLLQGIDKQERHNRVMEILEEVGLQGFENRLPTKLSGGQQQRVAIARAMVSKPALILADEPTANLDSKTSSSLLDMMKKLNKKTGMTFLFSTHDKLVMEKARRVITLKDGCIEKDEKKV